MSRVIHFEICAKNARASAKFYSNVFGWSANTWGGPMEYWLMGTGPRELPGIDGAVMPRGEMPQPVVNTVDVADLAKTIRKVEAAGGKKVSGPNVIPGIGTHAYFVDPEGIWFGAMQAEKPVEHRTPVKPAKKASRKAPARKPAKKKKR